jgi:hypothetical protein
MANMPISLIHKTKYFKNIPAANLTIASQSPLEEFIRGHSNTENFHLGISPETKYFHNVI